MSKITEFDILTNQPENLTVGQLNKVVYALREKLYLASLDAQNTLSTPADAPAQPLPTPTAMDEQHVQFAAVPVDLIDAMNMGTWRKGVIIFRGPHGEEARMYLHGIEPWPMIRKTPTDAPAPAEREVERLRGALREVVESDNGPITMGWEAAYRRVIRLARRALAERVVTTRCVDDLDEE